MVISCGPTGDKIPINLKVWILAIFIQIASDTAIC